MQAHLENIKIGHPQLTLCDKFVDFKIRQVYHEKITITNVDINILIINKLNSATNINRINHSQSGFIIASQIWFNLKRIKYFHKIHCINRLGQRNI